MRATLELCYLFFQIHVILVTGVPKREPLGL